MSTVVVGLLFPLRPKKVDSKRRYIVGFGVITFETSISAQIVLSGTWIGTDKD